jgi:predicted nuclease of restriction endonuclease-like (RecB) superfamily
LASAPAAAFPPNLGWAHYRVLLNVANDDARASYEIEATREGWSSRELERQVGSLLFERLARSRDKKKVLALARRGTQVESPADVIKEPFVLEFLGLYERSEWRERDLEQAIIDRIEAFLLELGKGFCFVAREHRRRFRQARTGCDDSGTCRSRQRDDTVSGRRSKAPRSPAARATGSRITQRFGAAVLCVESAAHG